MFILGDFAVAKYLDTSRASIGIFAKNAPKKSWKNVGQRTSNKLLNIVLIFCMFCFCSCFSFLL